MVKRHTVILSTADVRALLAACRGRWRTRDRALLVVCWRAGLRIAEALALAPADLELDAGLIHVRHGKGDKPRTVGIDPDAAEILQAWLTDWAGHPEDPLFYTGRGTRLSSAQCRAWIRALALRAGLRQRVHLHQLRHTFATQALREGYLLHEVQEQLGHANLSTTSLYLRHVAPEDLAHRARARGGWNR